MADDAIDIDVSDMGGPVGTVEPETTEAESSPVETKDTEEKLPGFDEPVEPKNPKETEAEQEDAKAEPKPSEETKADEAAEGEEKLAPKSENRFQKLANENRELREQMERLQLQETQLASEQELLNAINPETGDYYTPQEVERIAFAQSRQQQQQSVAQQRQVLQEYQSQQSLMTEATRALQEFPMFDEQNKAEYKPALAAKADAIVQKNLIRSQTIPEIDPNTGQPTGKGAIIGSNVSPYELYQLLADSTKAGTTEGEVKAQKATERMLAAADSPSGDGPKAEKKDSFLDGFESV